MSFQSSLQNSFKRTYPYTNSNKENEAPNFPTREGNTPEYNKPINPFSEMPSVMLRSIYGGCHSETTEHSLKTIIRQFYGENQNDKDLKVQGAKFLKLLSFFAEKPQLYVSDAITICETQGIFFFDELKKKIEGKNEENEEINYPKTLKRLLLTDLGLLKVEELCESLQTGTIINNEQQKILSILFKNPDLYGEITETMIWDALKELKIEESAEDSQIDQLKIQFMNLCSAKIWSTLTEKSTQIEFYKKVESLAFREQISYSAVLKILMNFFMLKRDEVNTIFRYIYALQNKSMMLLIDNQKKISSPLLLTLLLKNKTSSEIKTINHEKNKQYMLEDCYKTIQQLKIDNKALVDLVKRKDCEMTKMMNRIEILEIEASNNGQINCQKVVLSNQNFHEKYLKKIEKLEEELREQKKLTRWYQRELQVMIGTVNRENVMRRYFENEVKFWDQMKKGSDS